MNSIFVFYPHCYIKCTNEEILILDTLNCSNIYTKDIFFFCQDRESLQRGYLVANDYVANFLFQCQAKNLGYYVDFSEIIPFMRERGLNITNSLDKERKSIGYNFPSYTNSLLNNVTLLLNNRDDSMSEETCLQLDYPYYNDMNVDIDERIRQLSCFHHLERLILSGETTPILLNRFLEFSKKNNLSITHRILFNSTSAEIIQSCLDAHENLFFELLVDSTTNSEQLNVLPQDRVTFFAIVRRIEDLNTFDNVNNINYLPVLSAERSNTEIIQQMILTKVEILNDSRPIKDYYLSDYINTNTYGTLVIDNYGSVMCMGELIGSIYESDLSSILNRWLGRDNCIWYYSRKKKKSCAECALQALCPPISIYEKLGFYKCPCKM